MMNNPRYIIAPWKTSLQTTAFIPPCNNNNDNLIDHTSSYENHYKQLCRSD